jgi:hypothetical protein
MPAMPWNLTDRLSPSAFRWFHLPVASDPTGAGELPLVPPSRYLVTESVVDGMPRLHVIVTETSAGFPTDNGLPAAVIRLHAMGSGTLAYRPQIGSLRQCLLLNFVPAWLFLAYRVRWLARWLEADCVPMTVVYDNVDPVQLRSLLANTQTIADPVPSEPLQFPPAVRRGTLNKTEFLDRFMAGEPDQTMWVRRGACIGQMAPTEASPTSRQLGLTVRYQGHTDASPRPMLPRELFNLFFGNDSIEFATHPLLQAIQERGESETAPPVPLTQRMLLRPPLRTNARVVWEATQELPDHARWSRGGSLDSTKLLNTIDDFDRTKDYGPMPGFPAGLFKCQVFGFEMLFRSGFRVRMFRGGTDGQPVVFYYLANWLAREARDVRKMTGTRPGILGYAGEIPWGRRWDFKLSDMPPDQRAPEINRMIDEEGRAFYLVREFEGTTAHPHAGHFLLIERVRETVPVGWQTPDIPYPVWFEIEGSIAGTRGTAMALQWIYADVFQAPLGGLERGDDLVVPQWPGLAKAQVSAHASKNNDLLLIEAIPGPDPHTPDGVGGLCSIHQSAG